MGKKSQPWRGSPHPAVAGVCGACQDNWESLALKPLRAACSHLLSSTPPSGVDAILRLQAAQVSSLQCSCYPTSHPFPSRLFSPPKMNTLSLKRLASIIAPLPHTLAAVWSRLLKHRDVKQLLNPAVCSPKSIDAHQPANPVQIPDQLGDL